MCNERVDKRSIRISGCRMHDQAGWLLNNDEILVFMDDLKGYFLAYRNCRRRGRNTNQIDVAGFDPEIDVSYRFARMCDGAACDQLLKARTTYIAECGGKKSI